MRPIRVLFGSFERLVSVSVFGHSWGFCVATGVVLGGTPIWRKLGAHRATVEGLVGASDPDYGAASWAEGLAPVVFQCSDPVVAPPLSVGLVAWRAYARVFENQPDVYPFVMRDTDGQIECGFSSVGPDADIQDEIMISLGFRFLNAARIRQMATRTPEAD